MTKHIAFKIKGLLILSIVLLFILSGCIINTPKPQNPPVPDVPPAPMTNLYFTQKNIEDETHKDFSFYNLDKEKNINMENVSVVFENPTSVWNRGKNPKNYIQIGEVGYPAKKITVKCYLPFGEKIKITYNEYFQDVNFYKSVTGFSAKIKSLGDNVVTELTDDTIFTFKNDLNNGLHYSDENAYAFNFEYKTTTDHTVIANDNVDISINFSNELINNLVNVQKLDRTQMNKAGTSHLIGCGSGLVVNACSVNRFCIDSRHFLQYMKNGNGILYGWDGGRYTALVNALKDVERKQGYHFDINFRYLMSGYSFKANLDLTGL